jgi:long-subunit fatty acid transport protein
MTFKRETALEGRAAVFPTLRLKPSPPVSASVVAEGLAVAVEASEANEAEIEDSVTTFRKAPALAKTANSRTLKAAREEEVAEEGDSCLNVHRWTNKCIGAILRG